MNYIFLSYINRSGSTFLINQFSKLDLFCVCPEADILFNMFLLKPHHIKHVNKRNTHFLLNDIKFKQWGLSQVEIENILFSGEPNGEKFLLILELFRKTHYPNSKYILFKYNFILRLLSFYGTAYLESKFFWITVHRNPFNAYASQKKTISPHTKRKMAKNVISFCYTAETMNSMIHCPGIEKCLTISFENLVKDFNTEFNKIFVYLGIETLSAKFNTNPGKIKRFMSEDYKNIHPFIDNPPLKKKISFSMNSLSNFEIYYLNKKFPEWYPFNSHLVPVFKLHYPFLILFYQFTSLLDKIKKNKKNIRAGLIWKIIYYFIIY